MRTYSRALRMIAVFAFLAGVAAAQDATQQTPPETPSQAIEVIASNYKFTPLPIHVKVGQRVQLKITATDKTHGIRIRPIPDGAAAGSAPGLEFASKENCVKLEKGEPVTVEFVTHTAGTYALACCKSCGFGHGHMKGQIIAEP